MNAPAANTLSHARSLTGGSSEDAGDDSSAKHLKNRFNGQVRESKVQHGELDQRKLLGQ
jgi:hypothetical protein